MHAYVVTFVRKALTPQYAKARKDKYIFLGQLAQVTSGPVEIRDQLLSILVAGRDTTAGPLSFLFLTLPQKPEVFMKLRVIEHFGTDRETLSFDSLKSCQHLQWCLNEARRCAYFPASPGNSRRSVVDAKLPRRGGPGGQSQTFVPKRTEVNYLIYATHRAAEFWGQHKPESWHGRKAGLGFLSLNGGPRYV